MEEGSRSTASSSSPASVVMGLPGLLHSLHLPHSHTCHSLKVRSDDPIIKQANGKMFQCPVAIVGCECSHLPDPLHHPPGQPPHRPQRPRPLSSDVQEGGAGV